MTTTREARTVKPIKATVEQMARWMKNPPKTPKLLAITQEVAMEMLTGLQPAGAKQRPFRWSLAKKYARLMATGLWDITHQGIAIGIDGSVLNITR